jgi:hypothetical protein
MSNPVKLACTIALLHCNPPYLINKKCCDENEAITFEVNEADIGCWLQQSATTLGEIKQQLCRRCEHQRHDEAYPVVGLRTPGLNRWHKPRFCEEPNVRPINQRVWKKTKPTN